MVLQVDQYKSKKRDICLYMLDQFRIMVVFRFCRAAIDKKLGTAVMTMLTFFKLL